MNVEASKKGNCRICSKVKKLVTVSLIGFILIGSIMISNAATVSILSGHKCAFSLDDTRIYRVDTTTHPYTVVRNGKNFIESCTVEYITYQYIWRCACGASYYDYDLRDIHHLGYCGQ